MSKSRGNIVRPTPIADTMGVDALRYFLMREIVFGQDGSFSFDALVGRYNSDLANGLGNLASRTLTMIRQYRQGVVPSGGVDPEMASYASEAGKEARFLYKTFEFSRALEKIWGIIAAIDKFIVQRAPWKLAEDLSAEAQLKLDETLSTAVENFRLVCLLVYPVLPHAAQALWMQLGMGVPLSEATYKNATWSKLAAGNTIGEISPVFPRLDAKETVKKMQDLEEVERQRQAALLGKTPEPAAPAIQLAPSISIDDFSKVDLRVGEVKSAEKVKGADKLLHLKVDIGEAEPRTIVAGIALAYKPEDLVGRKVVIVANLEPRKLKGLTSQGMIVAASIDGGPPVLAGFHEDIPPGARLK